MGSNREKKDKMKVKQKNDLKDFLSATATIRKEAKKEEARKDEKRDQQPDVKKQESKTEDKPLQKRRLSSNSEVEEAEPKSKIPKLKVEGEGEPELKNLREKKLQRPPALQMDQRTDPNCPIQNQILNQSQDMMIGMVTDCLRPVIRLRIARGTSIRRRKRRRIKNVRRRTS